MLIHRSRHRSTPQSPSIYLNLPILPRSMVYTPRSLFVFISVIFTFIIIMSAQLRAGPATTDPSNITSGISTQPEVEITVEVNSEIANNDFGIEPNLNEEIDNGNENGNGKEMMDIGISNEKEKRRKELGAIEQAHIAQYKNGILGISEQSMHIFVLYLTSCKIYPAIGSELGGATITFIFALQNDSAPIDFPAGYFGGCIIDGTLVPLSNRAYFAPSQVHLLHCIAPPHSPGEVEVGFQIEGVTRYPSGGTVSFTYSSEISSIFILNPVVEVAICTVFQNQALYLREWIAFHSIFGVTKFYLYDQSGKEDWKESVSDFIASGLVVPIRWSFSWINSIRHQAIGFWHNVKSYQHESKWIAYLDVDEFMFIPSSTSHIPSFPLFLKDFDDVGGVMVDRLTYGPNGHTSRPPGLVIESYTKRASIEKSDQPVKSIVQPKYVRWAGCGGVHTFAMEIGRPNVDGNKQIREDGCGIPGTNVVYEPIRINHYWTKSVQDWAERVNRTDITYVVKPEELLQKWGYFNVEDTDIIRYAEETKRRILWGVNTKQG